MKKFKKVLLVAAALVIVALSAVGCKKTAKCFYCGDEKKCEEYEVLGEKINVCGDCEDKYSIK